MAKRKQKRPSSRKATDTRRKAVSKEEALPLDALSVFLFGFQVAEEIHGSSLRRLDKLLSILRQIADGDFTLLDTDAELLAMVPDDTPASTREALPSHLKRARALHVRIAKAVLELWEQDLQQSPEAERWRAREEEVKRQWQSPAWGIAPYQGEWIWVAWNPTADTVEAVGMCQDEDEARQIALKRSEAKESDRLSENDVLQACLKWLKDGNDLQ